MAISNIAAEQAMSRLDTTLISRYFGAARASKSTSAMSSSASAGISSSTMPQGSLGILSAMSVKMPVRFTPSAVAQRPLTALATADARLPITEPRGICTVASIMEMIKNVK